MTFVRILFAFAILTSPALALESSQGALMVAPVVTDLDEPWSIGFLPNGSVLISERGGRLWNVNKRGFKSEVRGVPDVVARGQSGLLDVMIPKDFAQTREVYLTFAKKLSKGTGTAVGRGTLSSGGRSLQNFEVLFEIAERSTNQHHFGGRLVQAPDGSLFLTVGDRGDRLFAQDLSLHNGSVLRLTRDGRPFPENPFIGNDGVQPEIWSYGHRNPQGAALDLNGNLVIHEHGARGGDEVNRIRKGANYGWPVISYGRHYTGAKIGEGNVKIGMEQPDLYWDPSIAPSGMMIYSGKLWPEWRGDIFVGSLKFDMISRIEDTGSMTEVERLSSRETGRVRDVREASDGSIWFLSVDRGTAYRITP